MKSIDGISMDNSIRDIQKAAIGTKQSEAGRG